MRVSTCNIGGRRIVRANRPTSTLNYAYELMSTDLPTIAISLEGTDGKSYRFNLTDGDIESINAARARYAEDFNRYNGK